MSENSPSRLVHHPRCPLCGGEAVADLAATYDLHYGIDGSWNYERCSACSVVFLNPAPTEEFLSLAYDDSYYSYQAYIRTPAWQTWLGRLIGYNLGATGDPKFECPGRLLDIGCGSGKFLFEMKAAGWEPHGLEISAKAADFGNRNYGLNIRTGALLKTEFPLEYFDYVRLNHSFEHLLDPQGTLTRIHEVLVPGGIVFIGVPNVESLQARLFGKYWWNLGPPVHPFNYSLRTLTWLLKEHGFEVITCRTNSNFSGILGSLQMLLNDRRGLRADTGRLYKNPALKLLSQWLAKFSDVFSLGDCLEITARKPSLEKSA